MRRRDHFAINHKFFLYLLWSLDIFRVTGSRRELFGVNFLKSLIEFFFRTRYYETMTFFWCLIKGIPVRMTGFPYYSKLYWLPKCIKRYHWIKIVAPLFILHPTALFSRLKAAVEDCDVNNGPMCLGERFEFYNWLIARLKDEEYRWWEMIKKIFGQE